MTFRGMVSSFRLEPAEYRDLSWLVHCCLARVEHDEMVGGADKDTTLHEAMESRGFTREIPDSRRRFH